MLCNYENSCICPDKELYQTNFNKESINKSAKAGMLLKLMHNCCFHIVYTADMEPVLHSNAKEPFITEPTFTMLLHIKSVKTIIDKNTKCQNTSNLVNCKIAIG